MRSLLFLLVLSVASTGAAQAEDDGSSRPAHFGMMYSCMTMPPEGPPFVGEGVPYVVERYYVGYSISRYDRFAIAGVRLFVANGRLREEGFSPRYSTVVGVDEAGALTERECSRSGPRTGVPVEGTDGCGQRSEPLITDRALFVRAARAVPQPSAHELARMAMAILLARADEDPLSTRRPPTDLAHPEQLVDPVIAGGTLVFSLRGSPTLPYIHRVTVELATGITSGAPY